MAYLGCAGNALLNRNAEIDPEPSGHSPYFSHD